MYCSSSGCMNNLTGGRKRARGLRRTKNRRSSRKMRSYRGGWNWPWNNSDPNNPTPTENTNTWGQWFGNLASSAKETTTNFGKDVVAESTALVNSDSPDQSVNTLYPSQEQEQLTSSGGKGSRRRRRTRTKRNKKTRKP